MYVDHENTRHIEEETYSKYKIRLEVVYFFKSLENSATTRVPVCDFTMSNDSYHVRVFSRDIPDHSLGPIKYFAYAAMTAKYSLLKKMGE